MIEKDLTDNRKIFFYDSYCHIVRKDALTDKNKNTIIEYENIKSVNYLHRKVKWIPSILVFILLVVLTFAANPLVGKVKRLEIFLKDGSKRIINLDSLSNEKIQKVIEEFNKRIFLA